MKAIRYNFAFSQMDSFTQMYYEMCCIVLTPLHRNVMFCVAMAP